MSYHQILFLLHMLAMALGFGIAFSNVVNLRLAKAQTGDVAKGLALQRAALHKYTDIAFVVLLASGGLLLQALGGSANLGIWFHVKMACVVVYVVSYVAARVTVQQIKKTGNVSLLRRVTLCVHLALTGALLAIVFAVLTFEA